MDVVILAAGRGTRLKQHTELTPKPLIPLLGQPILERILDSLPREIERIFIITLYKEEQIHAYCKQHTNAKNITCVTQGAVGGTYGALLSARGQLKSRFLVINGDDIDSTDDFKKLLKHPRAMGVAKRQIQGYYSISSDKDGNLENMLPQTDDEKWNGALIATGGYVLDTDFFSLPPVQLKNGEYGIPHTLLKAKDTYPVLVVGMDDWMPINTPDDLALAEERLR